MATARKISIVSPNAAKFEALSKAPTEPEKPKGSAPKKKAEKETSETPTTNKD